MLQCGVIQLKKIQMYKMFKFYFRFPNRKSVLNNRQQPSMENMLMQKFIVLCDKFDSLF